MATKKTILGFRVADRPKHIPDVQSLLTEYGCYIKTRIGLHDVNDNWCSPNGTILLELFGDEEKCKQLEDRLRSLEGVAVQKMEFEMA
ncbi:MAG: hypothetical protein ACOX6T_12035 [Myxococcales bacterium]|jgi:hypothetical protein